MITPNGTLIEVYENQNNGTTLKIETDGYHGGWLSMDNCDVEYLIQELQKHKKRLEQE